MSTMRKKTDTMALTDEEIASLSGSRTPELVRRFIARQQSSVGVRTSAYRKVAEMARAEREALTEIAKLAMVRERLGEPQVPVPVTPAVAAIAADLPPRPAIPERAVVVHGE